MIRTTPRVFCACILVAAVLSTPGLVSSQTAGPSNNTDGCYVVSWQLRLVPFPDTIELTRSPLQTPRMPFDSTRLLMLTVPQRPDSFGRLLYWYAKSDSLHIVANDGYSPLIIGAKRNSEGWAGQAYVSYDVIVDGKAQESERVRVYGRRIACPSLR